MRIRKRRARIPASKRLDSESKRNKLLHELVAVVLRVSAFPLPPPASFTKDGCHPTVSRRVCGPPSWHKDSYLTRAGGPPEPPPSCAFERDP